MLSALTFQQAAPCRRAARNGGEASPQHIPKSPAVLQKKGTDPPHPVLAAPLWPGAVCDPGRAPGLTSQDNSKNYIKYFINMTVATKDFFPIALVKRKTQGDEFTLIFLMGCSAVDEASPSQGLKFS